jgi:hypothetical protein
MTATQVFLTFLRETCTLEEYLFFSETIGKNNGNRYFKNRPLFKKDFVEGYLSRNNRHLRGFMTRLFILAPNLVKHKHLNPRWIAYYKAHRGWNSKPSGMYVNMYKWRWYSWLDKRVVVTNKKLQSPFKKGETYDFKLNNKQINLRKSWAKL